MNTDNPNSFLNYFGIEPMTYGEVLCAVFLKISISIFLTAFSARCKGWFWTRMPGRFLIITTLGAMICATLLALFWFFDFNQLNSEENPLMKPIKLGMAVFIWIYNLIFFVLQDLNRIILSKEKTRNSIPRY